MFKNTVLISIAVCSLNLVYGQTNELTKIMQEIESNNSELQSYKSWTEAMVYELKAGNTLPNPDLGMYYMPFGDNNTDAYTEFEITQRFEFPSVYSQRRASIHKQVEFYEKEYEGKKQGILLNASLLYVQLVYLQKWHETELERASNAHKVYEQVQSLFDKEQVGVLELNKAKIIWMQEKFKVSNIENKITITTLEMVKLNGGNELNIRAEHYPNNQELVSINSLWEQKLTTDPEILKYELQVEVNVEKLGLSKKQWIPEFTAGFNRQGTPGMYYSGIYGGISIPLWRQKKKVEAATAQWNSSNTLKEGMLQEFYSDFEKQFSMYQNQYELYSEYQNTLLSLESDHLLLRAYELGELSFMEYYIELEFYHKAYDKMLEIEKDLHLIKTKLLKHQI